MATKKTTANKVTPHKDITPDFHDEQSVKPGEIRLTKPSSKEGFDISSFYLNSCMELISPLAEMVRDGELTLSPYSTLPMQKLFKVLQEDEKRFRKMSRSDLADIYRSFSSDMINIIAVIKADSRYEKAWRMITESFTVTSKQIKEKLGRRPVLELAYSWTGDSLCTDVLLFPLLTVSYWRDYGRTYESWYAGEFTLSPIDRKTLADFLFGPEYAAPRLVKDLPNDSGLTVENFEADIPTDIITLEGLALNGSVLSANGSITAAKMKRLRQQLSVRPFRPDGKDWPLDRLELLCFAYFNLLEEEGKAKGDTETARLAKYAAEGLAGVLAGPNFGVFLPAYQGFTRTWTADHYARKVANTVGSILKHADGQWLSLENFRMLLLCFPIGRSCIALRMFTAKGIEKAQLVRKVDKEHEADKKWKVRPIEWFDEVGLSFAVHWIKFLCALGMVEIALTPDISAEDPLEGLRYVRLTPLGRFVLGLQKDYSPKTAQNLSGVEFDGLNGIITIDAKSPFQMFLGNIGRKIGPTRFRISEETLLKGCKTKAELEQRITNLKVIVDPEKEPALKKMIDGAMAHTDCAQREGGYSLLRLRPDLPGLREAILTDKELREMAILAGPTLALVKTHKMERFNTILASYGFLMD